MSIAPAQSPELAARLVGPDPVAGRAAEAEVRALGVDALPWLIELLGRDRWGSVPRAARLVGRLGAPAVDPLFVAIGESRVGSAAAAFRFLEVDVGDRLAQLLRRSHSGKMPWEVVRAVGEYGDATNATDLATLGEARRSEPDALEHVFEALERVLIAQREPSAAQLVLGAIDKVLRVRGAKRVSMHPQWFVFRDHHGWLDPVIEALETSSRPPPAWRDRAVLWLGISQDRRAVPALGRIAADPNEPSELRVTALGALGDLGQEGALEAVARAASVTSGLDDGQRSRFARAVDAAVADLSLQSEDPAALAREVLARAEQAGAGQTRAQALRVLGRHGTNADEDTILAALADEDGTVRGGAAVALARLRGGGASELLETADKNAKEVVERLESAVALTLAGTPASKDLLHERMCDPTLDNVNALVRPIREEIVEAFAATDAERAEAWAEVVRVPAPAPDSTSASQTDAPPPGATEEPDAMRGNPPAQADTATLEDQLGRGPLVNVLAAMIDDPAQGTPFTFALFGGWGEGKSSLLRQLELRLKSESTQHAFAVGWFNAWQYEKTDSLAAGLVQESVRALRPSTRPARLALTLRFGWRRHRSKIVWALVLLLLSVVAVMVGALTTVLGKDWAKALVGASVLAAVGIAASVVVKIWRNPIAAQLLTYFTLPDYGKQLGLLPAMREELEHLWGIRHGDNCRRLVIVVDDLDRCSPPAITATLDAVRLVMDLEDVIVILALDEEICLGAVAHEYRDLATARRTSEQIARDFLAKIVQLPIRLERPASLDDFIEHDLFPDPRPAATMPSSQEPSEANASPSDGRAAESPLPTPPPAGKGWAGSREHEGDYAAPDSESLNALLIREVMRESDAERKAFSALATASGISNPRQLRRLRNAYRFIKAMAPSLAWRKLMTMLFHEEAQMGLAPQGTIAQALATMTDDAFDDTDNRAAYRDAVLVTMLPRLESDAPAVEHRAGPGLATQ